MHPLKQARKEKGLSLSQLGIRIGLPEDRIRGGSQINHWERGYCAPNEARAQKLADILGFESGDELRRICYEWRKENIISKGIERMKKYVLIKTDFKEEDLASQPKPFINALHSRSGVDDFFVTIGCAIPPEIPMESEEQEITVIAKPLFGFATSREHMRRIIDALEKEYERQTEWREELGLE